MTKLPLSRYWLGLRCPRPWDTVIDYVKFCSVVVPRVARKADHGAQARRGPQVLPCRDQADPSYRYWKGMPTTLSPPMSVPAAAHKIADAEAMEEEKEEDTASPASLLSM